MAEPDPSASMAEPDPPASMTQPDPSASMAEPDPPASMTQPDPPASMTQPDPPASMTQPDSPASMTEPDPPASMTELDSRARMKPSPPAQPDGRIDPSTRRAVIRDALAIGLATGAYGTSFGAIAVASGLSVAQTSVLSLLAFTGASQFAFVGVVGGGGALLSAGLTALMLGVRNAFYGVRLADLLRLRGVHRLVGAHFVIDETTAMSVTRPTRRLARLGFWSTGLILFTLWNTGTLVGALAGTALGDPRTFGLDAAAPAAFLALLWPQLTGRRSRLVAAAAVVVALVLVPIVPPGVPVLVAGGVAVAVGLRRTTGRPTHQQAAGPVA